MWDNHQTLDALANLLSGLAVLAAVYLVCEWAIRFLPVLPLTEVRITSAGSSDRGRTLSHVTREQVSDVVSIEIEGNFLTVDLESVRSAFEKLPWVRVANVRRIWPQTLEVTLEEHAALARWGDSALVNTHGELFEAASDEKLPVFEGPVDSSGEIARFYTVSSELLRPLDRRVDRVNLSPRRAWRIRLDSGTVLELGREQMEARLERYIRVIDRSAGLLDRQLNHVDLRYPSGFAVR